MIRLVSLASLIIVATVSGYRPGDEVCMISKTNTCPLNTLKLSQTDASTLIYPGGKTRCAFDDFTSERWKTNATYFFQVFPKLSSAKLLLYFQKGGACLDDRTCNFATQCSLPTYMFNTNARAESSGILNATNKENIFHDWNIVHIPYCTGDIHIGNTKVLPKDLKTRLIKKPCAGKNMTMHLNGYENAMSALNWALANYPHPEQLVVSGSSAGALGAQYLAHVISNMWKVQEKKIKYGVLADSYVGVAPNSASTGALINYIGGCDILPTAIRGKCRDGSARAHDIMRNILEKTLFSDWLHITSKADGVQRLFAKLLELTHDPSLVISYLNPRTFFREMNDLIMGEKSISSRLSVFFVEGSKHVFLLDHEWYNCRRAETQETFGEFVKRWLANGMNR